MGILTWLKSIVIGGAKQDTSPVDGPTEADLEAAAECLDRMVKRAIFGDLGGASLAPDGGISSMWGGRFFGAADETIPICQGTGQPMRPLVQIRMDELPEVPACFTGLALLNIWVDLETVFADFEAPGTGFVIRTYALLGGLVPIGPAVPDGEALPVLPIVWRAPVLEQPHWDDIAGSLPASIEDSDEDWLFKSRYAAVTEPLYETCPVKLGGWPNWIQNSAWPVYAEFCFQIDSTDKGKFNLGDGGSLYIFRTARGWASRSDCY